MKLNRLLLLLFSLMALPALCSAQESVSQPENYVSQMNDKCPREFADGWIVEGFTLDGDTLAVTITVSDAVAAYLPMIKANADQTKAMWIQQMPQYGSYWNQLVELLLAAQKQLVVNLRSSDGKTEVIFVFQPDELKPKL